MRVNAVHFLCVICARTSNLTFSPPLQGSDADKSDDNLVVDEVSRRPPAPPVASRQSSHLHKTCKQSPQHHLNDNSSNDPHYPPLLRLLLHLRSCSCASSPPFVFTFVGFTLKR